MECPICSDNFNEEDHCPRLLRCGHTCCEQCLNHVIKNSQITCPTCRDISLTPSAANLPKNYTVLEIISNQRKSEITPPTKVSFPVQCDVHPDEKVIRYCLEDSKTICAECILDHASHKLVKLDDPVLEIKFELRTLISKVEEMISTVASKHNEMQVKQATVTQASAREMARIDNYFERMYEKLELRKKELKAKVNEEVAEFDMRINKENEGIDEFMMNLNQYLEGLQELNCSIESLSTRELANSSSLSSRITSGKREVHCYLSQMHKITMLDSNSVFSTKTLFNTKPLEAEIAKYGTVTVGEDIHNPAIYCFGTQNIVLKFNLSSQRWSQSVILETNGYEFKNFASIAALPSGSILITGGTKSNEVYEFKENRMYKRCNMLHIRSSHNAIYFKGFVYCIGGYNGSSWHDRCEKISVENFTSMPIATLNCRRCAFSSCVSGSYIYVFGGYDGSKYLDVIERYSVTHDRWETLPCVLHRPLQNTGAACYAENKILIAGGYNEKGTLSVVKALDLETLEWTTLPAMSHTRYLMNKFHFCGGLVYAIGGSAQGQNIEYFSVSDGTWATTKSYKEFTEDTMYKWATVITHDTELYR
mmetsp:Transcript_1730/g.3685  ORF Transcript_1730/g.3685 Transcript_1730/m.3685 type:complete len:592 (+) Transcript_1730:730-2505(+)